MCNCMISYDITYTSISAIYTKYSHHSGKKNNGNKNNKNTFSIKMKEDVGTSKPKKHANKVGRLT